MSADESGGISDLQEVVIETPRGSRNKYKMDEQTGRIKLSKVMPEGMVLPLTLGTSRGQKARMAILWMCLC
jgi:inorganic pyrophosphatase